LGVYYRHLGANPQDDDVGITITDTSFLDLEYQFLGSSDTVDSPAWGRFIDFKNEDSIFYLGTHRVIFDFYPEWPSWIMFGQLDQELNRRFTYYYGGDAYYWASDVVATSDGGCIISAQRYDYLYPENGKDLMILKYDRDDLITGLPADQHYENSMSVFPNPGTDRINVMSSLTNGRLLLYNSQGMLQTCRNLEWGLNSFDVSDFPSGIYVYVIQDEYNILKSDKWIKY